MKTHFTYVFSQIKRLISDVCPFLSNFFVKKIPLSRRVGYVVDGSMGQ